MTSSTGTVTAASDWDAPAQRKHVRPSLPESIERRLHGVVNHIPLPPGRDGTAADLNVAGLLDDGKPGDVWFVQPGRPPGPYGFRGVPGPRA